MIRFNYFTFKFDSVACPNCKWEGTGKDMKYGEFYDDSFIAEFQCPTCGIDVGFLQFPMKEEVEKWKKENPGKNTGWENNAGK